MRNLTTTLQVGTRFTTTPWAPAEPLRAACDEYERDYDSVEITSMWDTRGGMEMVQQFADIGVSRLIVPLFALGGNPVEGLQKLSEDIIANL